MSVVSGSMEHYYLRAVFRLFWFHGSCYAFPSDKHVVGMLWQDSNAKCSFEDLVASDDNLLWLGDWSWHEVGQESVPVQTTYDFHLIFLGGLVWLVFHEIFFNAQVKNSSDDTH